MYIGVDVQPDRIRAQRVDVPPTSTDQLVVNPDSDPVSRNNSGAIDDESVLIENIRATIEEAKGQLPWEAIIAVGISHCGFLDFEKTAVSSRELHLRNVPIVRRLSTIPVRVELCSAAESLVNFEVAGGTISTEELRNLVYVRGDYGFSTAITSNGEDYRGEFGRAGQIGLFVDDGIPLEAFASRRGISSRLKQNRQQYGLEEYFQGTEVISMEQLKLVAENNRFVHSMVETAARKIGYAVASLINAFDPSTVILGGDLFADGDFMFQITREVAGLFSIGPPYAEVRQGTSDHSAGVHGSAIHAFTKTYLA